MGQNRAGVWGFWSHRPKTPIGLFGPDPRGRTPFFGLLGQKRGEAGVRHQLRWRLFSLNSLSKGDFFALRAKKHRRPPSEAENGVSVWGRRFAPVFFRFAKKRGGTIARQSSCGGPFFSRFARKKVYGLNFLAVWGRNLNFLPPPGGQKPLVFGLCQSAFFKKTD